MQHHLTKKSAAGMPQRIFSYHRIVLFYFFNITQLPAFVKERLGRAIPSEVCKPSFARHRFYPVAFFAFRRFRAKVNIY
jgi:hypothetical protein